MTDDLAKQFPVLSPDYKPDWYAGDCIDETPEEKQIDWVEVARSCIIPQGVDVPVPITLFAIADIPVMTIGELSLLIAKPKQGKSTVASWVAGNLLTKGYRVLVIDTEMGLYYASRTQYWILRVAGLSLSENLIYIDLKRYSSKERRDIIGAYLEQHGDSYDLVIIDGVRDLLNDINDNKEVSVIVNLLMKWAVEYNCHILNILHKNKTDNNARGTLGTELMNKCETSMDVSLEGSQIVVTPLYTRNETFAPFAFTRDSYGIPHLIEGYVMPVSEGNRKPSIKWHEIPDQQHERILMDVFKGDLKPKRSDLETRLSNCYGAAFDVEVGGRKVKALLDYLMNDIGLIKKEGKDNSPKSFYYLTTDDVTDDVKNDVSST